MIGDGATSVSVGYQCVVNCCSDGVLIISAVWNGISGHSWSVFALFTKLHESSEIFKPYIC